MSKKITPKRVVNYILRKLKLKEHTRKVPKLSSSHGNNNVLNGIVSYNQYGGYFIPLSSRQRPAVQTVLNGKVHEPDTIRFMIENCGNGDIIHAGTFFGDFLPGLSSSLANESLLWAFEPNRENFKCAQITCLINQLTNVKLHNAGLGDENTNAKMLVKTESGTNLGGASKIVDGDQKGETIEIDILKIDDAVPANRNITILQLDVEGYEKQALTGAMMTIKRNKPILILEDNNKIIESAWFKENILQLGYEIVDQLHENTVLRIKQKP